MEILGLFTLFALKHLLADYFLQFSFMFKDKGIYGGKGGISHSGVHGVGTFLILTTVTSPFLAILFGILDSLLHYHIDFTKSYIRNNFKYPEYGNAYWMLHGTDQFLHMMTYVLIIFLLGIGI